MHRFLAAISILVALVAGSCSSADSTGAAGSTSTTTSSAPGSTTSTTSTVPTSTSTVSTGPASTVAPDPDAPPCAGDDWVLVDVGPFRFSTPSDLVDQNAQGIDSLVGRYVGGGLELSFDFGWYSPRLDEIERLGATITPISLGDLAGEYGTADASSSEYETDFLTHLFAEIPGDSGNALWMGVGYDDPALTSAAECVVSTVRFS